MRKIWILAGTLLALAVAGTAMAAPKAPSDTPPYDPNHEYTVHGTITETRTHMSAQGYEDMHVLLDTGHGVFEVHLAPVGFLRQHGLEPAKGDEVVITGALATWEGAQVFVAREIVKGAVTVEVRGAEGSPAWRKVRA